MNDIEMVGPAAKIDESSTIEDSYCCGEFITSRIIDVCGVSSMDNLIADV